MSVTRSLAGVFLSVGLGAAAFAQGSGQAPRGQEGQEAPGLPPGMTLHPPVDIQFNTHDHGCQLGSRSYEGGAWLEAKARQYERHKENILWLAAQAEERGRAICFQMSGERGFDSLMLPFGDPDLFGNLQAAGHSIGVHFHLTSLTDPVLGYWEEALRGDVTVMDMARIWRDHVGWVQAALSPGSDVTLVHPATNTETPDEWRLHEAMIQALGIESLSAKEGFSTLAWDHFQFGPHRRLAMTEAQEDRVAGTSVSIPTTPQIGQEHAQGAHSFIATLPQIQRAFFVLLANRAYEQMLGLPARPWSLGLMTHVEASGEDPGDYREEIVEAMDWIQEMERTTDWPGRPVARWATDKQTLAAFGAWEVRSGGAVSSFDFDLTANEEVPQAYPYLLEGVALGLARADFDRELDLGGSAAYRFVRRELLEEVRDGPAGGSTLTLGEELQTVILLWGKGPRAPEALDLRAELTIDGVVPETLFLIDGESGAVSGVFADRVPLTIKPCLVTLDASFMEEAEAEETE